MNYVKKYLTTKETADYLGTTVQAINIKAHKKQIRYYKPTGGKTYFAVADIEEYITSGAVIEAKEIVIKETEA